MTSLDDLRLCDFLQHIVEAIERCQRYTAAMDEATFLEDDVPELPEQPVRKVREHTLGRIHTLLTNMLIGHPPGWPSPSKSVATAYDLFARVPSLRLLGADAR